MSSPVITLDGTESTEGRATLLVSALTCCLEWLPETTVRFADVANENVVTAIDSFRFTYDIDVDIRHPDDRHSPLAGADLYVAITFRSTAHLRIAEARRLNIPVLLAVQYPEPEWTVPSVLLRREAAFDPCKFALALGAVVKPWL